MPPKKGEEPKALPLIGRFGTSLKIGIVGLPNVGKSTFFNVLTKSQASAENFPFCTIDPNESRVPVPDERFDYLCEYHKPASKVPAFLNVVDIAGLVKGAHAGQGLGNAFLSHISACDAIFHMTRAFEDEDIIHVEGSVDPVRDIEIIHEELRLKDEEFIMPIIDKLEKVAVRGTDKKLKPEYDIMCKIKNWVIDEKKHVRFCRDWNEKEIDVLNKHLFLTSKPMIYLVNLSEKDYIRKKNKWLAKIKEWVDKHDPGALVIPFSGGVELKFQDMSDEEKQKYLEENKTQSVLTKIIKSGYAALLLEYFFTAGPDEVRAWTIRKGTKAPQAAGKIHTDFEKGFIMAEVMKFEDFKEGGTESAVKAAGKYRQLAFDVVIDGLNVANTTSKGNQSETLLEVVSHLAQQNLRLLVLGRKHMLRGSRSWDRKNMSVIQQKADCFFTDNISEDDPFLLYATLHSGNHCKFLSRDLMRDHKACLPDSSTRRLFFKWQRGHQLVLSSYTAGRRIRFETVPKYDTIIQTEENSWHIPYDEDGVERYSYEVPRKWLCLEMKR